MGIKSFLKTALVSITTAFALTACSTSAIPNTPPAYSLPPEVATEGLITLQNEAVINMSQSELRAWLLDNPFITFFEATENISPPDTTEQLLDVPWYQADAVRRVQLEDGHYVIERILENRPELFKYQVWVFTNDAGRGVDQIIGEQFFMPIDENSTKFIWKYNLKPKSAITRIFVNRMTPELQVFMDQGTNAMTNAANEYAKSRAVLPND